MALLLPGVVLRGWGGVVDGINGVQESGCMHVSQPSRLSIAIETGEHAHRDLSYRNAPQCGGPGSAGAGCWASSVPAFRPPISIL